MIRPAGLYQMFFFPESFRIAFQMSSLLSLPVQQDPLSSYRERKMTLFSVGGLSIRESLFQATLSFFTF